MTYKIVRLYFNGGSAGWGNGRRRRVTLESGLTLEQAQAHCRDPETSSRTATGAAAKRRTRDRGPWFDAYEHE